MARQVKFVKSLVVENAMVHQGDDEIRTAFMRRVPCVPIDSDFNEAIETMAPVETHVSPIIRFCEIGKPDVFIAYSPEVEELLGVPFSTMHRELKERDAALSREREVSSALESQRDRADEQSYALMRMKWWDKLNFLFAPQWTLNYLIGGTF